MKLTIIAFLFLDGKDDDCYGDYVRSVLAPTALGPVGRGGTFRHLRLRVLSGCLDVHSLAGHVVRLLQPYSLLLDEQTL